MPLANVDSPNGFALLRSGGQRAPVRRRRVVAAGRADPLMVGDAYSLDASGQASLAGGTDVAVTTVRGVVEGIILAPIAASPEGPVSQDYIPAADAGAIIGIEDLDAEFVAQITTIAAANIGMNVDLTNATASSVVLRQSRQELDGAVLDAADREFRVIELLDKPADNALGANARVVVKMRHVLA